MNPGTRKPRLVPVNKRFPGKYAVKARIYWPSGAYVDIETHVPDEYGKELVTELCRAVGGRPPRGASR